MSITQLTGNERLRAALAANAMRSTAAYAAASAAPARKPDSVELSDSARSLSAARTAIATAPEVREDRVSAIKAAIADGTYAVDSRQLARAMIGHLGSNLAGAV